MVSLLMALAMIVPVAAADATVTIKNKGDNEELKYIQVIVPDRETKTGWKFADTTMKNSQKYLENQNKKF